MDKHTLFRLQVKQASANQEIAELVQQLTLQPIASAEIQQLCAITKGHP